MTATILLQGTVGSRAYGLDHPDSDTDRLGVIQYPTESFLGLSTLPETAAFKDDLGDVVQHELKKWIRLALKCNPTVMELVWLDSYETKTWRGLELVGMRGLFLSKKAVRNSYLGYASNQFERLKKRGDGSFSSTLRNQTEKHARHMYRLLMQGAELHDTGHLTIRVSDPEQCFDFGRKVGDGYLDDAETMLELTEHIFDSKPSPLADEPSFEYINDWLIRTRTEQLFGVNVPPRRSDYVLRGYVLRG